MSIQQQTEHKKIEHVHAISAARQLAQSIGGSGCWTSCPYCWEKMFKYKSNSSKEIGNNANKKTFLPKKEDKIWEFCCWTCHHHTLRVKLLYYSFKLWACCLMRQCSLRARSIGPRIKLNSFSITGCPCSPRQITFFFLSFRILICKTGIIPRQQKSKLWSQTAWTQILCPTTYWQCDLEHMACLYLCSVPHSIKWGQLIVTVKIIEYMESTVKISINVSY